MLVSIEINAPGEITEYSKIYNTESQLITDGNELWLPEIKVYTYLMISKL